MTDMEIAKKKKNIMKQLNDLTEEDWEHNKELKFTLNFELAQCISKTEKTLQYIGLLHYSGSIGYESDNTKLISIVFANNSLLENAAWKSRSVAKFKNCNIKVQRMSSQKNSDYINRNDIIASFVQYASKISTKNMIPDILIMCNHPTRINDMCALIDTIHGTIPRSGLNLKYNVFFDECDSHALLEQMCKFIRKIINNKLENYINEIQLITATPGTIIPRLKKIVPDVDKLFNIDIRLDDANKLMNNSIHKDTEYRTIISQEFIPHEGPKNPIEYVNSIFEYMPTIFKLGKIYFIPSEYYTSSHEDMADIFIRKGFWVLILNGKNKEFRNSLGEKIDVMKALKDGRGLLETRDIVRAWREKNPNQGLIITGKVVVERGITFLTNGFNFDYMIISSYFVKNINSLVQIVGRGQGRTKYVDNFKVIMPILLWEKITKYVEDCEAIKKNKPEFYDENMLSNIGKEEEFSNLEPPHFESTIEDLGIWIKQTIRSKKDKPVGIKIGEWKRKNKNSDGFIMHKFGGTKENPNPEKVWSEEEALKQIRRGIAPYSKRIIPCYSDMNDVNSLKWYVFYRNE